MSWSLDRTNFERNIAVVIGINNYGNGIHPLRTAVNDARAIADLLEEEYEYQEVIRLFPDHGEATLAEINQLLFETLPNEIQPTEGDRLLFYFAGHGIARNSEDGPAGALIPQNATLGEWESFFPMRKLNEALSKLDCHHLLVILDCCFAGNFRWSSSRNVISALETIHREHYDRFIRYPAWQAITSAAHNQEALDYTDERGIDKDFLHSPFAKALIDGLKDMKADLTGDKVITAPELYLYLRDSLIGKDGYSELQTAGLWPLQKHDRGEFIFTLPGFVREELKPAPPLDENNNPYRGLQSFDEKHARFFFGRQQLVNQLSVRVSRPVSRPEQQLTVVLGISGSGKSSLVKAGLISRLRKATNSFELTLIYACIITLAILEVSPDIPLKFLPISYAHQWEILEPIRPGESPFDALAKAIFPLVETQDKLADNLKENSEHLSLILSTWSRTNPNRKLLLAIDQFEELITMSRQVNSASNQSEQKDDIQKQFLALLINAIKNCPQLHIVLTLRSDFEPRFIQSALKEYWTEARFPVRAMNLDELRQAIEQPAAEMALYFEPANLVNQLIDEVSQMPGALPLLSFTLSELYIKLHQAWVKDGKQERALSVDEEFYKQGGIAGSLSSTANKIYNSLLDDAHRDTMRRVMLRMVALEGGEPVRRRVPLSELNYANKQEPTQLDEEENQRVKVVIESLNKARLVVSGQETGEPYVEPAHDFLVKGWDKLQKWQEEEQENLLLQRRLTPAASDWKKKEQPPSLLAKTEPFLTSLDKKIDLTQDWLKQIQEKDIQQLLQEARVRLQSTTLDEKGQEQPSSFLKKTEPFLNLLDKTFGFAEDWLIKVRQDNNQERPREKKVQFLWNGNPYLEVLRKTLKSRDYWFNQVEAEFVQQSIWQKRRNVNLRWFLASAAIIVSSSLTVWALIGQKQALIEQINANQNSTEAEFRTNQLTLETLISSLRAGKSMKHWLLHIPILGPQPDKEWQNQVITTLRKAVVQVKERNRWQQPEGEVEDMFLQQDGTLLMAIKQKNTVWLWNSKNQQFKALISGLKASFSPDGHKLAIGMEDGSISFYEVASEQFEEKKFPEFPGSVESVTFSSTGRSLALIIKRHKNQQRAAYLLDLQSKYWQELPNFSENQGISINYIRFINGDTPVGIFTKDYLDANNSTMLRDILVWDYSETKYLYQLAKANLFNLNEVKLSFDGKQLALINRWKFPDIIHHNYFSNESKRYEKFYDANFSPNGQIIALAGENGSISLYEIRNHHSVKLAEWKAHKDRITAIQFSIDGKKLITTGEDGIVRLWDVQNQQLTPSILPVSKKVESVSVSPDGQKIIIVDDQGNADWLDLSNQNVIHRLPGVQNGVISAIFSPNSKEFAVANKDGTISVRNFSGKLMFSRALKLLPDSLLTSPKENSIVMAFRSDGELFALLKNNRDNKSYYKAYWLFQEKTNPIVTNFISPPLGLTFNSNGNPLYGMKIGNITNIPCDGCIYLLDLFSNRTIRTLETEASRDSINLGLNIHGNLMAIADESYSSTNIKLWDVLNNQKIMLFQGYDEKSRNKTRLSIKSISLSDNGSRVAIVTKDGKVQLWQLGGLDELLKQGCQQVRDYLATLDRKNSDRHLCDGIGNSRP